MSTSGSGSLANVIEKFCAIGKQVRVRAARMIKGDLLLCGLMNKAAKMAALLQNQLDRHRSQSILCGSAQVAHCRLSITSNRADNWS